MMISIILFLALAFLFTIIVGRFIEKIRVPWIFAALILGFLLAISNPFSSITSSETFNFLAQLGMYFLLFMIGFKLDLKKLEKNKKFIIKATFFIIFFEAFFGSLIIHFVFGYNWIISSIVALSFATVGEAILIPILDEFKIINTKFGQSIIGVGSLDDIIEIITLILAVFLIGSKSSSAFIHLNGSLIIELLFVLFVLTFMFIKFKKYIKKIIPLNNQQLFLLIISILFLFLSIGEYAYAAPVAALLSGIAIKSITPKKRLETIERQVNILVYGLFAPIFFLWVGLEMDISYLIAFPLLVLLVVLVSKSAKILSGYIIGRKELGVKKSILMGIGLSVRFSTSIIIIKILFDSGIINSGLYSVIIASSIAFKFIVPVLFSNLLVRWKIAKGV